MAATIDDFTELKKRIADDGDVIAVNGLKKELADLRAELKRESTEYSNAMSDAEKANKQLLIASAQRDQSDETIVDLKKELRRLKERLETNKSSKA